MKQNLNTDNLIKVSVVVPVYNGSIYIEDTLRQLRDQTLEALEIICVDDGSTDDTCSRIEAVANKDVRVLLVKQEHEGAGEARNKGLELARGKAVIFLDADDIFDNTMLAKLYERLESSAADICLCKAQAFKTGHGFVAMNFNERLFVKYGSQSFMPQEVGEELLTSFLIEPWNKLYRRSFILDKGLKFQKLARSNDLFFTSASLMEAQKLVLWDEVLVSYRLDSREKRGQSTFSNILCFYIALNKLYDYIISEETLIGYKKAFTKLAWSVIGFELNISKNTAAGKQLREFLQEPQLAQLGITEAELRQQFGCLAAYQYKCLLSSDSVWLGTLLYKLGKVLEYKQKMGLVKAIQRIFYSW